MEPLQSQLAIHFHLEHLREVEREVADIRLAQAVREADVRVAVRAWPGVLPRLVRELLALR